MNRVSFDNFSLQGVSVNRESGEFSVKWEETIVSEEFGEYTIKRSRNGYNYLNKHVASLVQAFYIHALSMNNQAPQSEDEMMEPGEITDIKIWDYEDPIVKITYMARFAAEKKEKHNTGKVILSGGFYKNANVVRILLLDLKTNLYSYLVEGVLFSPTGLEVDEDGNLS